MTPPEIWHAMDVKLIAILRGITPSEAPDVVAALLDAGFRAIEVTMNSPDPLTSIGLAVEAAAPRGPCLIGAGTVLSAEEVAQVKAVGGNLIVSPDVDSEVVSAAVAAGMASFPGVFTPTEAHKAVRLGATGLKMFPASHLGPSGIKAIKATLPDDVQVCAVGGVDTAAFADYHAAGVCGFGLGTSVYRPGKSAAEVAEDARLAVDAFTRLRQPPR